MSHASRSLPLVGVLLFVSTTPARADDLVTEVPVAKPSSPSVEERLQKLQAQLDELNATAGAIATDQVTAKEATFRLYGFIDMGLQKQWTTETLAGAPATTFVLGNVNIYLEFHPADDWSSLIEVRLTNFPGDKTSEASDPGNGPGDDFVRWSGIVLERAYIQWKKHERFGLRVGEVLTPYGIWNVDHGTPTLISLQRPEFMTKEMWPTHMIGVEAFGQLSDVLPGSWQLEYHAYVSNGRSPGAVDPTDDKTFGGHVIVSTQRPNRMAFGVSAMSGTFSDSLDTVDRISGMTTGVQKIAYRETGIALDASIDVGALRLRSELITRHVDYRTGERTPTSVPGVVQADSVQGDLYALAAYRLPHTRFEPYLYAEAYRSPTLDGDLDLITSVGLNVYFSPAIQLKLQYQHSRWYDTSGFTLSKASAIEDFVAAKLVMGL